MTRCLKCRKAHDDPISKCLFPFEDLGTVCRGLQNSSGSGCFAWIDCRRWWWRKCPRPCFSQGARVEACWRFLGRGTRARRLPNQTLGRNYEPEMQPEQRKKLGFGKRVGVFSRRPLLQTFHPTRQILTKPLTLFDLLIPRTSLAPPAAPSPRRLEDLLLCILQVQGYGSPSQFAYFFA